MCEFLSFLIASGCHTHNFMKPISKYCYKMNVYLLFIVFLYIGGCNARVVPLSFKSDKSGVTENELIDESPIDEVEILGHNIPDIGEGENLELLHPEVDNTTVLEISNRNASSAADLTPEEKATDEESNLKIAESSAISIPLEELNSTSEFRSQNNSDSRDSFETIQVNGTVTNKTEGLKNETTITNNSSSIDMEQGNNLDFSKIEKVLNHTLDHNETSEVVNRDQNGTFVSFDANSAENETFESSEVESNENETSASSEVKSDGHETFASFEVESDQNETFASFEVVDSDQNETFAFFEVDSDQNETFVMFKVVNGTNNTNDFFELHPLSNDTKVEGFLTDTENATENFKSSNSTSEHLELTNDSIETAGGIFSGFEFLINSEVARNAAKAMEVFNFSDPLTDHIMEENEFHSFLPAFNAEQDLDSPNQTDLKSAAIITNTSGESNEISANFNTSLSSGDETSSVVNEADPEETEKNSSMTFNLSEPLDEGNKAELFDLEEKFKVNVTSEASSPLENSEEKINPSSEATISNENIKGSISDSSSIGVLKCPPPGWCIFWFLSQDACAVNEHCLGNRICCKMGCSNTCIEVESL